MLASPLDELDKAIVKRLQVDGRAPYKEIAGGLDVSAGTVRNRVTWMTQHGVLRIVAVADPAVIHYRADAMLGVKVAPGVKPSEVAERLAVYPQVGYILWISGRYDLLVEVVCDADADFLDFVADHVPPFSPGIPDVRLTAPQSESLLPQHQAAPSIREKSPTHASAASMGSANCREKIIR